MSRYEERKHDFLGKNLRGIIEGCSDSPWASIRTIRSMEILVPRMTGFPAITSRFVCIRSCVSILWFTLALTLVIRHGCVKDAA